MQQSSRNKERILELIEKAGSLGVKSLSEDEALELFCRFAVFLSPRCTDIEAYGCSLRSFIGADGSVLESMGVERISATLLSCLPQLADRLYGISPQRLSADAEGDPATPAKHELRLQERKSIERFIKYFFSGAKKERVLLAVIGEDRHICKFVFLEDGKVNRVDISIDKIVRTAQQYSSSYVILAHNHPSSSCYPSAADYEATFRIHLQLREHGIKLLDHFIVTESDICSVADFFDFKNKNDKELYQFIRRVKNVTDMKRLV